MNNAKLFLMACLGLLGVLVLAVLIGPPSLEKQSVSVVSIDQEALERLQSPSLGPREAKVVITEFLDPACGTCRVFYPLVKGLMDEYPNQIRLVVRFLALHEGSDQVVALLLAARRQDKLWPTLEAALKTQRQWAIHHVADVNKLLPLLGGLGLDLQRLQLDMNSSAVSDLINQDRSDARTLKVHKTPGFFVNGKPLVQFGYEELKYLVQTELESAPQ
ncbi:MAG: disulfide bond formation protein DsbA [Gammaproteobacteria bacterium]|mgnify:CR=1 FL=1|nr:disulfide bond formation protein DsbA [Gammaproteobacteria bacterium]|tara:strand:- start:91 stop:744 length:654 start_codon:yes stop_codon:yes gene_type:complete